MADPKMGGYIILNASLQTQNTISLKIADLYNVYAVVTEKQLLLLGLAYIAT